MSHTIWLDKYVQYEELRLLLKGGGEMVSHGD